MILVDTSVWVDHFRRTDRGLVAVLEAGQVLMHPFILGELACADLPKRAVVLQSLSDLPAAPVASDEEALHYIDRNRLRGRGIGYVDAHLLASVTLEGTARLWTRDRWLADVAADLNLSLMTND